MGKESLRAGERACPCAGLVSQKGANVLRGTELYRDVRIRTRQGLKIQGENVHRSPILRKRRGLRLPVYAAAKRPALDSGMIWSRDWFPFLKARDWFFINWKDFMKTGVNIAGHLVNDAHDSVCRLNAFS
jgi:hypothetical protein